MLISLVLCFNAVANDLEALRDWIYTTPEGQLCSKEKGFRSIDSQIKAFEWSYTTEWSEDPIPYTFYTFLCDSGAYNFSFLIIEKDTYQDNLYRIVDFAIPVVDFEIEEKDDEASTEVVKAWSLIGFLSTDSLINPHIDTETKTLESFYKARGLGDAFDVNRYAFKNGSWLLIYAEQDPTFDGQFNPITVFEP